MVCNECQFSRFLYSHDISLYHIGDSYGRPISDQHISGSTEDILIIIFIVINLISSSKIWKTVIFGKARHTPGFDGSTSHLLYCIYTFI